MSTSPRIAMQGVCKQFAGPTAQVLGQQVLQDVALTLEKGEFVCLLGASGCGKTTVLHLLAGFEQADQGTLLIDGQPIAGPGPDRGMVFQQPTLFPWLSVLDNVTFGPRMAGQSQAAVTGQAMHFLRMVGLQNHVHHFPWQLSGGMRQRAALARAWLPGPEILLMDEPFGALDAQTRLAMQELLTGLWQTTGTTILFVTHDVDEALYLADRVLIMASAPGRIRTERKVPFVRPRSVEDLVADPAYGVLKRDILHIVREESAKSLPAAIFPSPPSPSPAGRGERPESASRLAQ
ncbi:ABC transporter ATP-binding protein [Candidatus Symbiobacter mobilis]|uniref:ABC-type sulfonate/nitrate/taurine transporter ATP-binding protein n=1 Tax=Candidatus Symbiobacter mobilis CR TaxID=946483 RepID=U5N7N9_9BURK|nr:ABC transporter ATP-binding protein [Candidatus Symbiobacter mobilis]AGX87556.1 ABC-type sulfonate/nitrate/taurine transporter ATP-binding protein [Candidatus Symbiobacter mobilis CR]